MSERPHLPSADDYGRVVAELTRRVDGGDDLERISWSLVADITAPAATDVWLRRCTAAANLLRGQVRMLTQQSDERIPEVEDWVWHRVDQAFPAAGRESRVRARAWARDFCGLAGSRPRVPPEPIAAAIKLARWRAILDANEVALHRVATCRCAPRLRLLAQYGCDLARLDEVT